MVKQTGQHGYLFRFDKVNATASFLFIRQIIFSSEAESDYLDEPVDNAVREDIIRFFPLHYTIAVKKT